MHLHLQNADTADTSSCLAHAHTFLQELPQTGQLNGVEMLQQTSLTLRAQAYHLRGALGCPLMPNAAGWGSSSRGSLRHDM